MVRGLADFCNVNCFISVVVLAACSTASAHDCQKDRANQQWLESSGENNLLADMPACTNFLHTTWNFTQKEVQDRLVCAAVQDIPSRTPATTPHCTINNARRSMSLPSRYLLFRGDARQDSVDLKLPAPNNYKLFLACNNILSPAKTKEQYVKGYTYYFCIKYMQRSNLQN